MNSTTKKMFFNVYKYFERESVNSKYRGPPKLTHITAEVTPAKRYKVDRKKIAIDSFDM